MTARGGQPHGRKASPVDDLVELIRSSHAHGSPPVVEAIFPTTDPLLVARELIEAVAGVLDVPVAAARFYEPGVGVVVGLEVADGRAVVAKVHRPAFTPVEHLAAITRVQADLAAAGVPAPAPIAGPVAVAAGWLTVEDHRPGGTADGYDPAVRSAMAHALADFVEAARPHAGTASLGSWLRDPVIGDLWHEPHDLRFDFEGTAAGAAWIDDVARAARATLVATTLPDVVGHLDWRVQNLGFDAQRVAAIYDWDSVGLVPEAALVASASVIHPVDWRLGLADPLPTIDQVDSFVADYEAASGRGFGDEERRVLAAAQRWVVSYGARCLHSDDVLGLSPEVDHSLGWPRLLRDLLDR
jgi:hypothetical protein